MCQAWRSSWWAVNSQPPILGAGHLNGSWNRGHLGEVLAGRAKGKWRGNSRDEPHGECTSELGHEDGSYCNAEPLACSLVRLTTKWVPFFWCWGVILRKLELKECNWLSKCHRAYLVCGEAKIWIQLFLNPKFLLFQIRFHQVEVGKGFQAEGCHPSHYLGAGHSALATSPSLSFTF